MGKEQTSPPRATTCTNPNSITTQHTARHDAQTTPGRHQMAPPAGPHARPRPHPGQRHGGAARRRPPAQAGPTPLNTNSTDTAQRLITTGRPFMARRTMGASLRDLIRYHLAGSRQQAWNPRTRNPNCGTQYHRPGTPQRNPNHTVSREGARRRSEGSARQPNPCLVLSLTNHEDLHHTNSSNAPPMPGVGAAITPHPAQKVPSKVDRADIRMRRRRHEGQRSARGYLESPKRPGHPERHPRMGFGSDKCTHPWRSALIGMY
ncbi:collagen alpha-1(I) chain-like protein [Lates japonicus]|uniref:Collagen alpha-1(I) chain-like protein n=1 Tax=Lates japonicus TaxID=270547 RepID=A0AAD3MMQ7_LATJO|nr:collagen alpha-1(I) chain-like protein [Lates japonicus]